MSTLKIKNRIKVEFLHTPPYSPNLNLAEYIIHLLRLKFLHHLPLNITIDQIKQKLSDYFLSDQLQTPKPIKNTRRIQKLTDKCDVFLCSHQLRLLHGINISRSSTSLLLR